MARTKLIAKYAALDTPDFPERIFNAISNHIADQGIDDFPNLELNGRWTGKLSISDGGWRGDFDFLYPVISMCRVDRDGNVLADMAKIEKRVAYWRERLHTPHDDDRHIGVCDETFNDDDYLDDDAHEFYTACYRSEMDHFINSKHPDFQEHDQALTEIDNLFRNSSIGADSCRRNFGEGFGVQRIDNPEEYRKIMKVIQEHAESGAGHAWINPDFDMDSIEDMFADNKNAEWLQWIDDLRNHRFGTLPTDFDGLAEIPD